MPLALCCRTEFQMRHWMAFSSWQPAWCCFSFVAKTELITHWCHSCYWAAHAQHQGLFYFSLCPLGKQTGRLQEVGRGCSWDSWPYLIKGIIWYSIPDNIMLPSEKGGSLPKVAVAQRLAGHWWWNFCPVLLGVPI